MTADWGLDTFTDGALCKAIVDAVHQLIREHEEQVRLDRERHEREEEWNNDEEDEDEEKDRGRFVLPRGNIHVSHIPHRGRGDNAPFAPRRPQQQTTRGGTHHDPDQRHHRGPETAA